MYVDRGLPAAARKRLLAAAVAAYRAHPQVEAVFTVDEIAAAPIPTGSPEQWTLLQRVRASYYPGRSGDFYVILKKDVTPIADTSRFIATHGSVWDYDRRVPILFWRPGAPSNTLDQPADTVDILPTLARLIGLDVPLGSVDGHCLGGVSGVICDAPAGTVGAERGQH
jgi:hypothetical protein